MSVESIDFLLESADSNAECSRQKICGFVYLSAMIFLAAYTSHGFNSPESFCDTQQSLEACCSETIAGVG